MKLVYADNPESRFLLESIEWAETALQKPNETFKNGKTPHEIAGATIDEASDALIDHLCVQVTPLEIH